MANAVGGNWVMRMIRRVPQSLDALAQRRAKRKGQKTALRIWRVMLLLRMRTSQVATARFLAGEGRFDDAFSLLKGEIGGGRVRAKEAVAEYRTFCQWLANGGYLAQAEARLAELKTFDGIDADGFMIDIWFRRAVLDPKNRALLIERLGMRRGNETETQALWLLYMIGEPAAELLPLYEKVIARGNNSAIRDYVGVAAELSPDTAIGLSLTYKDELRKRGTPLSVDLMLARKGEAVDEGSERERWFAERFEEGRRRILARLADPSVSIAVVGNSGVEAGKGQGAAIDAHDIVIRFNKLNVVEDAQVDYGSRIDMLVTNYTLIARFLGALTVPMIVTGQDWEVFTTFKNPATKHAEAGIDIATVPRAVRKTLNQALKATSSSGIQILSMLAEMRSGLKNVDLYGFSLIDQIGEAPTSANYFRSSRPSANHNWRGEAIILDALRNGQPYREVLSKVGAARYENQWRTYETFRPLRIKLEGDHSNYHVGSAAVTQSLMHHLAATGVVVENGQHDVLVVNGEGSVHDASKGFHRKMKMLRNAIKNGKAAYLVNSVWQDNPHDYDDVLKGLNAIYVREVLSQADLLEKHGIISRVYPDLSYYAPRKKPSSFTDYKGAIVMTDFYSKEYGAFMRYTRADAQIYPYVDMFKGDWDELVASLKTASLLITGRHHAVYAACVAEIPFVAFGGNTHKIEGLFRSAGADIPLCESRAKLPEMIKWAQENGEEYKKLFKWLKSRPTWKL